MDAWSRLSIVGASLVNDLLSTIEISRGAYKQTQGRGAANGAFQRMWHTPRETTCEQHEARLSDHRFYANIESS